MRRRLVAGAAALMAAMGFSLTAASAATLDVATAPATFFMQESACAPATNNGAPVIDATVGGPATANSYERVSLSDIPANCQNLPLEVFVHGPQGALVASTTTAVSASSSTATVDVGNYTGTAVTQVVVRIDGWLFPTVWTAPAPANPTPPLGPVTCYQLDANGNLVTDASGQGVRCSATPAILSVTPAGDDIWSPADVNINYLVTPVSSRVLLIFDLSHSTFSAYRGDPAKSSATVVGYDGSAAIRGGACLNSPILAVEQTPAWGRASGGITLVSSALGGTQCPR